MARFIIGSVDLKTTKEGKQYKKINVKDEGGVITKDVSIWPDFSQFEKAITGATIEGVLAEKGQYTNIKDGNLGPRPAGIPYVNRNAAVGAAMAQKEASIGKFQDNKEHSIMVSGTARDATIILNALMQQGGIKLEGDEYKAQWIKIRYWLVKNWDNLEQPTVGSTDIPYPQSDIDEFDTNSMPF